MRRAFVRSPAAHRAIASAVAAALAAITLAAAPPTVHGASATSHPAPGATQMAIITHDQAWLRAAPRDSAQQQAVLAHGEVVEVRGERMDYVQVYDHKRERGGYVRAAHLKRTRFAPEEAAELLAVVRFVREQPGAEALGIGYVAAYLKAAPTTEINSEAGAEALDALGHFAERLARRASGGAALSKSAATLVAAHLDVAARYGVTFNSYESEGRMQVCYDGDAFGRVLAISTHPERRARAALALTRSDCINPALRPSERSRLDEARADALGHIDTATLPPYLKNRVHLRRASLWSSIAYQRMRQSGADAGVIRAPASSPSPAATQAAQRALNELASINKTELTDDDLPALNDAAMRVNASRWAAEPAIVANAKAPFTIVTEAGQPGETCVTLTSTNPGTSTNTGTGTSIGTKTSTAAKAPLARRCTYGIVWTASFTLNREGNAAALAVQPMDAWRELWVFRKDADGWSIGVLPPAATAPDTGYAEFAGWVPGGSQMLAAREARGEGKYKRSYEVVRLDGLTTERQSNDPSILGPFQRWQDAGWVKYSASVR